MRILIFHGYLLRGTGSNIYNANLARSLAGLGHEVHLFCQDRSAQEPEGVTIHVPDIGRVSFPKIPSGGDSRGEAESGHHLARCSGCSTCLGPSSPTCSSRNVGLKSRTSFSDISSILH
jgi:hypothetical protein